MKEIFIIGPFIYNLSILEFISCINKNKPIVLIAPVKIIRPIMVILNVELSVIV
jgi:hypothetical protein